MTLQYIVSSLTCRKIQGVQEDNEIAISRSWAIALSRSSKPSMFLVLWFRYYAIRQCLHDIITYLTKSFYSEPMKEHAMLQTSAENLDRRSTNLLRKAFAQTTTLTNLEWVIKKFRGEDWKKLNKTEEVEEVKAKMLVQGCHPSAKMATPKTVSSKTAPPVKLRWLIILNWCYRIWYWYACY